MNNKAFIESLLQAEGHQLPIEATLILDGQEISKGLVYLGNSFSDLARFLPHNQNSASIASFQKASVKLTDMREAIPVKNLKKCETEYPPAKHWHFHFDL